jgi:DNA-binding CsgD family transcriptional regulator
MVKSSIKPSAAFASMRRIAALGHPGRIVMASLLEAIRDVVPFDNVNFIWMDEDCNAVDMHNFDVAPPEILRLCQERYFNRKDVLFVPSHRRHMRELMVDRSAVIPGFSNTEFFDDVFRPSGYNSYLRVSVRNGVEPIGVFHFYRQFGSRDFSLKDERAMLQALPWITHALTAQPQCLSQEPLAEAESGLVVTDRKGNILYFSQGARMLLHQASGTPIDLQALSGRGYDCTNKLVASLVQPLVSPNAQKPGVIPARHIQNSSGVFQLRAYWLEAPGTGEPGNVAIQIRRQIPLSVKLLQSMKVRALPPREQQACLLLTQGRSSAEIAKNMDITPNGVVYHIRSLYNRLGISRREELVSTLLAQ